MAQNLNDKLKQEEYQRKLEVARQKAEKLQREKQKSLQGTESDSVEEQVSENLTGLSAEELAKLGFEKVQDQIMSLEEAGEYKSQLKQLEKEKARKHEAAVHRKVNKLKQNFLSRRQELDQQGLLFIRMFYIASGVVLFGLFLTFLMQQNIFPFALVFIPIFLISMGLILILTALKMLTDFRAELFRASRAVVDSRLYIFDEMKPQTRFEKMINYCLLLINREMAAFMNESIDGEDSESND